MPQGDLFILMLLLWTFVGRGVDGERVTGVLHRRVELRGRYGHSSDVATVEWLKYLTHNTTKMIYLFNGNSSTCIEPCQNITFNLQNISLTLVHLTQEDEGIYEEKITFKNGTVTRFNVTLSLLTPTSPVASQINVSSSPGSLTLKCEINEEVKLLRWFRNGSPLPDDQRFSLTENNTSMKVSNLSSSDCTTYTCQVSNENGTSEAHINVTGNIHDVCMDSSSSALSDFIKRTLFPVGLSLISLLVLCLILIPVCKYYDQRKVKTTSTEESVYNEPTSFQEEAAPPTVDPLLIVYQDFIKPKDSHQSAQSEDFGYSTIADVLQNVQPSQTTCTSRYRLEPAGGSAKKHSQSDGNRPPQPHRTLSCR